MDRAIKELKKDEAVLKQFRNPVEPLPRAVRLLPQ